MWGQHGVHWVKSGLDYENQIMVYNNGNGKPGMDFSQIQLVDPPQESPGFYSKNDIEPYGPLEAETIYGDQGSENFYSAYLSNAQMLPNGNTLINAGSPGLIFEITNDREIAWEYEIPLFGDFPATQGQNISDNANFRAYKFGPDFPGFDGLELTPGLPIELNPNDCELISNTSESILLEPSVRYDAISQTIHVRSKSDAYKVIKLYSLNGNQVFQLFPKTPSSFFQVDVPTGIYALALIGHDGNISTHKILLH